MKRRTFNFRQLVEDARAGRLSGSELRKAIVLAEEFGNGAAVEQLELYRVQPNAFAGDSAPDKIKSRVAQGISALVSRGESLSRTRQMLKNHGVIETLNRIAKFPAATKNFDKLCAAGLVHLTAEAIVLDFPDYFSAAAIKVARERLEEWKKRASVLQA